MHIDILIKNVLSTGLGSTTPINPAPSNAFGGGMNLANRDPRTAAGSSWLFAGGAGTGQSMNQQAPKQSSLFSTGAPSAFNQGTTVQNGGLYPYLNPSNNLELFRRFWLEICIWRWRYLWEYSLCF